MNTNQKLFDFIQKSPTAFHAVQTSAQMLKDAGYTELLECNRWELEPGRGYFVTRNNSSLIAFRVPDADFSGFMMTAAHGDSPAFKIKEHATLPGPCNRLSVEKYGGMLCSTWMDRPMAIAGRALLQNDDGAVEIRLVDTKTPVAVIPSVAIHMNRNANDNASFNPAVDMLPLSDINIPTLCGGQVLAHDLFLYNPARGTEIDNLIVCPRLDDLQCAYAALTAFLQAEKADNCPVFALFDNEEVGSQTKQGAASTFLFDTLNRFCEVLYLTGEDFRRKLANSFLVSCDNAHAQHPNHPEFADKNHAVHMNKGVVIKYNANQRYTSDAVSSALFQAVCKDADVPVQLYANRADMAGGSTLGNIANTQVSLNTVDIGLAQLAMHSSTETAGALDTDFMIRALTAFYGKTIAMDDKSAYRVKLS